MPEINIGPCYHVVEFEGRPRKGKSGEEELACGYLPKLHRQYATIPFVNMPAWGLSAFSRLALAHGVGPAHELSGIWWHLVSELVNAPARGWALKRRSDGSLRPMSDDELAGMLGLDPQRWRGTVCPAFLGDSGAGLLELTSFSINVAAGVVAACGAAPECGPPDPQGVLFGAGRLGAPHSENGSLGDTNEAKRSVTVDAKRIERPPPRLGPPRVSGESAAEIPPAEAGEWVLKILSLAKAGLAREAGRHFVDCLEHFLGRDPDERQAARNRQQWLLIFVRSAFQGVDGNRALSWRSAADSCLAGAQIRAIVERAWLIGQHKSVLADTEERILVPAAVLAKWARQSGYLVVKERR